MKKTFYTALALIASLAPTVVHADEHNGSVPQSGATYSLYNVGTKQYLGIKDGTLVLGGDKVLVTFDAIESNKTPGFYRITSGDQSWSAQLFGAPRLSDDGKYQEWRIEPVEGKDGIYTISSRNTEASASYYVYENSIYNRLAVMPQKPASEFEAAQWQLVSGGEEPGTPINAFHDTDVTYTRPNDGFADTHLYRTFNLGQWNTFCSPTDIDANLLKESFGEDVKVAELTGYSRGELKFTSTDNVKAGVPYIINITQAPNEEGYYAVFGEATYADKAESVDMGGVVFYGTLSLTTPKGTVYGFNAETSAVEPLSPATSEAGIAAMSGYFATTNATAEITSWSLDGTTGIGTIGADATPKDIYTIGGQKVKSKATTTDGLQRGIYVVKGKKTTK